VHLTLLTAAVMHNPKVADLSTTWLAMGDSAHSYRVTYVPPGNEPTNIDLAKLTLPTAEAKIRPKPRPQAPIASPIENRRQPDPQADAGDRNTRAGSALGTVLDGPITGHEVHVAYPVVYPDPPVARSELPRDVVGDVVVEVTIDAQGNVVETKIVQAIGHGIDEKIEATLRRWHYQPATLDGIPVASRHDVHFHFPS
jgi:TonB family protein